MDTIERHHALDMLRRDDSDELRAAYRRIPPVVLLSIMKVAGMAERRPPDLSAEANAYENGMQALAVEILTRAGFDSGSILSAAIAGSLEGERDDRHDDRDRQPILDGGAGYDELDHNPDY